MITSHVILAGAWILFCLLHSVLASPRFKQFVQTAKGSGYKFYRLYYTIFASLTFFAVLIYNVTMPSYKLFSSSGVSLPLGIIICALGLTIMGVCIVKYFMQLSGLRGLIENRNNNELMITGIHKIVRHPLYAGTFMFIWGLLIALPYLSLLIPDIVITVYTLIGLELEEKKLEKEFGNAYKLYKQKVPMLIPDLSFSKIGRTLKNRTLAD